MIRFIVTAVVADGVEVGALVDADDEVAALGLAIDGGNLPPEPAQGYFVRQAPADLAAAAPPGVIRYEVGQSPELLEVDPGVLAAYHLGLIEFES